VLTRPSSAGEPVAPRATDSLKTSVKAGATQIRSALRGGRTSMVRRWFESWPGRISVSKHTRSDRGSELARNVLVPALRTFRCASSRTNAGATGPWASHRSLPAINAESDGSARWHVPIADGVGSHPIRHDRCACGPTINNAIDRQSARDTSRLGLSVRQDEGQGRRAAPT